MVATSQPLASLAGRDVLAAGGSAVDAAIAANAVLAVTEPFQCGPGGDLFALMWDPAERRLNALNASGRSSRTLELNAVRERLGEATVMPFHHGLAVTVPGAVSGWAALHERYGKLPFGELFTHAIAAARDGFPVTAKTALAWAAVNDEIAASPALDSFRGRFEASFTISGRAPAAGELMRNAALASTFEHLAANGAQAFYSGQIGEAVCDIIQAAGGAIEQSDLLAHTVDWVKPISLRYGDYDVFELPPNGQGLTVLQMLQLIAHLPESQRRYDSVDYWHQFIEAKKLAFEDRARFYADPDAMEIEPSALLSEPYAASRAALIDPARARGDYEHGEPVFAHGDTTYLCTADDSGQMVSLIQSNFVQFGAGLVPDGCGFPLQCRGAGFSLKGDHPNAYGPGKRPFHTIIPAFVLRRGAPWMAFGVMGADMQPQAQVQTLMNMMAFGCDVQAAAELPRLRHVGGSSPNGEIATGPGVVHFEADFPSQILEGLQARGHELLEVTDPIRQFMGGYQAIQRNDEQGARIYHGGSEPRYDGLALGL